jgi:hypothetical protein
MFCCYFVRELSDAREASRAAVNKKSQPLFKELPYERRA